MTKKISAVVIVIGAFCFFYLGAISPFIRAREYIRAVHAIPSLRTLDLFEEKFNRALLFPSPIGKEEIVKFFGNDVLSIISQSDQPEPVARELVRFLEPHLFRNNVRHLLIGGQTYFILWQRYGEQEDDLKRAEEYFREALAIGPKLPPVLLSLRELYRVSEQQDKLGEINSVILHYWPDFNMST